MAVSYLIDAVFVVRNALQFNSIRFGVRYKPNESKRKRHCTANNKIHAHTPQAINHNKNECYGNNSAHTRAQYVCMCVVRISLEKSENNGKIVCEIFRL